MMYDAYDALSAKEYRKVSKDDGQWKRLRGASKVHVGNGFAHLMSYDTVICDFYDTGFSSRDYERGVYHNPALPPLINGEPTLWINSKACDYSNTTCRHLSLFLSTYVNSLDYYDVKHFVTDAAIGEIKKVNGVWIVCI